MGCVTFRSPYMFNVFMQQVRRCWTLAPAQLGTYSSCNDGGNKHPSSPKIRGNILYVIQILWRFRALLTDLQISWNDYTVWKPFYTDWCYSKLIRSLSYLRHTMTSITRTSENIHSYVNSRKTNTQSPLDYCGTERAHPCVSFSLQIVIGNPPMYHPSKQILSDWWIRVSLRTVYATYRICAWKTAPRFLGQEFGNNDLHISRTRFYSCEIKKIAIAFAALAAFTAICQWCHGLPTSGNQWCRLLSCNQNMPIHR
jgi:hypothetical protein